MNPAEDALHPVPFSLLWCALLGWTVFTSLRTNKEVVGKFPCETCKLSLVLEEMGLWFICTGKIFT